MRSASRAPGGPVPRLCCLGPEQKRPGSEVANKRSQGLGDAMKSSLVWISFDLGIQGDYEGMYSWLDSHDAQECGDSVAALTFEYQEDLLGELKQALKSAVVIDKKVRMYVIWRAAGKLRGRFIFGARKSAPWAGYGPKKGGDEEDVA